MKFSFRFVNLIFVLTPALLAGLAFAQQNPADSIEWIPLCSKCIGPSISSKSGLGTANAVAEGKATLKDAQQWCSSWEPDNQACPKEQLDSEEGRVYRISANCPAGKLTSYDGSSYTYAGVWNGEDIGEGRPKFRGSDGKIVGRDNASNGLGLAAQWEILCLRSEAQKAKHAASPRAASPADACSGKSHCDSNKRFSAEVIQLTAGPIGNARHHLVRMTIRFTNLTEKPLVLAYVTGSSLIVDDLGNHYAWGRPGTHDVSTQSIGILEGRRADAQFQLDPGESRKALFGVIRYNAGRSRIGTSYNYDVTIAELEKLPGNQARSVKQYILNFPQLPIQGW
jgi:hypothetical protein